MKNALSEKDLEEYKRAESEFNSIQNKFNDRFNYIIQVVCGYAGCKLNWWYFHDAQEGECGTIPIDNEYLDYQINYKFPRNHKDNDAFVFIDKDKHLIDLEESIPRRWLFEDFEKEIKLGKEALKEYRNVQVQKSAQQRLKEQALEKLSKEERKALGIE